MKVTYPQGLNGWSWLHSERDTMRGSKVMRAKPGSKGETEKLAVEAQQMSDKLNALRAQMCPSGAASFVEPLETGSLGCVPALGPQEWSRRSRL